MSLSDFFLNLNGIMYVLLYYYVNTNTDARWAHHIESLKVGIFSKKNRCMIHYFRSHFSVREYIYILFYKATCVVLEVNWPNPEEEA